MKRIKIVFLYTELATYFLSCLDELIASGQVEVHLVRWPLNKEAPFDFNFNKELHVYDRKKYSMPQLLELIEGINPELIFCSGWVDKGYKKVCKKYKKKIPVVVGIDNQWVGTSRQKLAVLLSKFLVRKYFNKAWVPGQLQKSFARKLGFKEEHILTGFYSADVDFFNTYYNKFKSVKESNFPKKFIYVGRYLSFKGIYTMWESFIEVQNEMPNEWELWCLGTGSEYDQRIEHEKIKHFGFVQPNEIEKFISETGVFILPSTFEPWGVVIHEFAASGFPIITTNKVGAANQFVKSGVNGFIVEADNKEDLKKAFKNIINLNHDELIKMSKESHQLGQEITPKLWSEKLLSLLR